MIWRDVVAGVRAVDVAGDGGVVVSGVQYDSRRVVAGDVFVAMRGGVVDGNRYIRQALERGAAAVVTDSAEMFAELRDDGAVPVLLVKHGRRGLAEVSSVVFGRPQDKLKVSAVTGTNGKTTTAFLLAQMLESAGRKCVLVGTIETRIAGVVRESEHTTPESRDLLEIFAEGVKAGCTEVVMEASSHALEQGRMWNVPVDVAIFTNLTQDHLDYHGSMASYAQAKMMLFNESGTGIAPRVAVLNNDAEYAGTMRQSYAGGEPIIRYGIDEFEEVAGCADYKGKDIRRSAGGTAFRVQTPVGLIEVNSPLTGTVNVFNLLAAMCAAEARGVPLREVALAASTVRPVPGRFEVVPGSAEAGFTVVVDYAHTDDALKNLMELGRGLVGEHGGRVITMFGCGGDRDRTKRAKMGRVAGAMSDLVVVTSDNPRSEEPMEIINEVVLGVRETQATYVVEEDRRAAIGVAIAAARAADIVLLAGKGHEKVQVFADGAVEFDDVAVAAGVLRGFVGFGR